MEEIQGPVSRVDADTAMNPAGIVPQPNCYLLTIPQEMRDHIYEYVFPDSTHVALVCPLPYTVEGTYHIYPCTPQTKDKPVYYDFNNGRIYIALHRTCRQLRDETKRMFWDKYTFSFMSSMWMHTPRKQLIANKSISGLLDNMKHVEVELPLLHNTTHEYYGFQGYHGYAYGQVRFFAKDIFGLLKDCGNLESFTIRNGAYVDAFPESLLGGVTYANDFWLEGLSRCQVDFPGYQDVGNIGTIGRYVANNGPLSKVKRKMIFNLEPSARAYHGIGSKMLNRWLYMLHRHWGGELWFNNRLIRSDDQHFARVVPLLTGPSKVLVPYERSPWLSHRTAPVGVSFRPVDSTAEEDEWLGTFNDRSTRMVNHLANGHEEMDCPWLAQSSQ